MSTTSTIEDGGAEAHVTRRRPARDEDDESVCVQLAGDEVRAWTTRSGGEDERGHQRGDEDDARGAVDEARA